MIYVILLAKSLTLLFIHKYACHSLIRAHYKFYLFDDVIKKILLLDIFSCSSFAASSLHKLHLYLINSQSLNGNEMCL